jgi:hypothetical protein
LPKVFELRHYRGKLLTGKAATAFCLWLAVFSATAQAGDSRRGSITILTEAANSPDWKTRLLGACRQMKEEIELNCDKELIRSSIAAANFDVAMEAAAAGDTVSDDVKNAVEAAARAKEAFDAGEVPDFAGGRNNLRLRRFAGASVNEFVLLIPRDYDAGKKWPLYVEIDPRRRLPYGQEKYVSTEGMVNLWWQWPKNETGDWKSFEEFFELVRSRLNIDQERIYMTGDCANGIAAMDIAFHHPDMWAQCIVSVASSYRQMAGNMFNVPFTFLYSDVHEGIKAYYDFAAECFEYNGCPLFERKIVDDIHAAHAGFVPSAVRVRKPPVVKFSTDSLAAAKAYWVTIEAREDENFPAVIEAAIAGQTVSVKTDNVTAYSLALSEAPIDAGKPIEIVENGARAGMADGMIFTKRAARTQCAKNARVCGPVSDVFMEPYAVIRPGLAKGRLEERIAGVLAGGAPVYADSDVPAEAAGRQNLVLVGTSGSNAQIKRINEKAPVQVGDGYIGAAGRRYQGPNFGAIFIMPNPENPARYAAVFAGLSDAATAALPQAYSVIKERGADAGVFEVGGDGKLKWHIRERLDTAWGWHRQWGEIVAVTSREYPKMKWVQLFGRAMRTGLDADAAICEDPFVEGNVMPVGDITLRELNKAARNDWIVKIRLDGKTLKKMLTTAFTSFPERQVKDIIVDGIGFSEGRSEDDIPMSGIADDKQYTVAIAEQMINGQRAGVAIEDYEIVEDGWLILLVRDFLLKNTGINALLENVEPRVF